MGSPPRVPENFQSGTQKSSGRRGAGGQGWGPRPGELCPPETSRAPRARPAGTGAAAAGNPRKHRLRSDAPQLPGLRDSRAHRARSPGPDLAGSHLPRSPLQGSWSALCRPRPRWRPRAETHPAHRPAAAEAGLAAVPVNTALPSPLRTLFRCKRRHFPFRPLCLFGKKTITHSWSVTDLLTRKGWGGSPVPKEHPFLFRDYMGVRLKCPP